MATNEQMKTEFSYFGEVWTFFKKYYEVRQSDDWEVVVADAAAINQKYHCPLCKDLILAILDELERRSKINEEVTRNDK